MAELSIETGRSATGASIRSAAALLRVKRRRLRQLVAEGRLVLEGRGHQKRVTWESLKDELVRRKLPRPEVGDGDRVLLPVGYLNLPRYLGEDQKPALSRLPEGQMVELVAVLSQIAKRLADMGHIRTARVGCRQCISIDELEAWAAGRES